MRYEYVPPSDDSRLDHMGTYKRTVPVSLQRMYENALDWEHLPFLHASSFTHLNCEDSGAWGWRASVVSANGQASLLELRLDRSCRRWITRNLEGPNQGAEIWTHVFERAERELDLVIDFFVPGVAPEARVKVGRAYAAAYEVLYDEDVWMMTERQRILDQRLDSVRDTHMTEIPAPDPQALPCKIEVGGRAFMLNKLADDWVVYPAVCPHQLGPLTGDLDTDGGVTCPWHGYRFDVRTGECTTGSHCRFGEVPVIEVDAGAPERLRLSLSRP
ncbi:MAG: Rieske (2Fe-2S) protein [Pseudomonadota bacterium]